MALCDGIAPCPRKQSQVLSADKQAYDLRKAVDSEPVQLPVTWNEIHYMVSKFTFLSNILWYCPPIYVMRIVYHLYMVT